ncbi:MAG: toll/interleukin-1 receptor domain-containing protein [Bryobacterales bacterium]|nr:toll/interleukin-1 receptor domain-containing protein [Bryobacterales bacterium]
MPPTYQVVLVHHDLEDFAREVAEAIRIAAGDVLVRPELLDVTYDLSDVGPDAHVAVVYLGSTAGGRDSRIATALEDAVSRPFPVLPIVRSREIGSVREKLPSVIENINAANWDDESVPTLLRLLAMLGLVEHERKVFLSYRRTESTPMALQLHTELVRRRFDVFLDRFALHPGEDFQQRLDEDLGDKAFVVLLESSDVRNSPWVEHEIVYAHSHRIDVLAITLPGVAKSQLVPVVDEAFRIRLSDSDHAEGGELAPEKLASILERIELAHAKALRRRREQMLGSLRDQLIRHRCACSPVRDWTILATAPCKIPTVFLVTPRRPRSEDLYAAHLVRSYVADKIGSDKLAGAVVHEVEHLSEQRRSILAWIAESGHLKVRTLRECKLEEGT